MENIHQQERLQITEHQIKEFIWWYKKFYGKWKTVEVWPGKTKTTFTSYENNGNKCINAKNVLMDTTRTYNPEKNTINVLHDDTNTIWRTLAEDWELDKKNLENDLKWFQDCIPSLKEKISNGIKNVFTNTDK